MFRLQGSINSAQGPALDGVDIYVCSQPATTSTIPPSPLATIYTDAGGGTTLANPIQSDGLGNWFFYAPAGTYTLVYYDPLARIPTTVFLDQQISSPGAGTVTSVALSMPAEFSVAGSPVIAAGTFAVTKANQNVHLVYAGPGSGPAAAPGFRALVAGDLPAGVGTVTSVALTFTPSALFSSSVTGSPIVGAGTLALTLGLANQTGNKFLASPTSGGSGPVTARLMVPADFPGQVVTTFSATPVFDASTGTSFKITLTGDVTSSSVTNPTAGERIAFIVTQDATGSRLFTWPTNFKGASAIAPDASFTTVQEFIYDGVSALWRATGPGLTMS